MQTLVEALDRDKHPLLWWARGMESGQLSIAYGANALWPSLQSLCDPRKLLRMEVELRFSEEGVTSIIKSPCIYLPDSSVTPGMYCRVTGVAGGIENRPSVLYSSLIKRTHHRQPLLKYPVLTAATLELESSLGAVLGGRGIAYKW